MTFPKTIFTVLGLSALPFATSAAPGYDYATGPRLIPAGLAEDSCAGEAVNVGAKLEMLPPSMSSGAGEYHVGIEAEGFAAGLDAVLSPSTEVRPSPELALGGAGLSPRALVFTETGDLIGR